MTNIENNDFEFAHKSETVDHYSGKSYSYGQLVWHRFLRNKGAVISAVVLIIIALIAILAPYLSQYSPTTPYPNQSNLAPGVNGHWFGTDNLGRDIFVRVAAGTSVSLRVALVAMAIDLVIGTSYGLISGYFGGK
ncbi:MAG: ABC transporter permease, partial [Lactobacillus sp.]|nr:ABC transporter permease [Lactobacillus sp.]